MTKTDKFSDIVWSQ